MWGAIKKAINSNLSKSLDVLIQEKTGELGAHVTGNASTTNNHVSACRDQIQANIQTLLNGRVVKSVQRGVFLTVYPSSLSTVYISSVNPSKCIVLFDGNMNNSLYGFPVLESFTETSINFVPCSGSIGNSNKIGWQVIEFY